MKGVLTAFFFISCWVLNAQKAPDEPLSYQDDLDFEWQSEGTSHKLWAVSRSHAPIEVLLTDRSSQAEVRSVLLPSFEQIMVLEMTGPELEAVRAKIRDSLQIGYYFGHPDLIKADLNYPYLFPFRKGKKYEVSQGFNGKTSHHSEQSRYAIDFQLNVGEPVFAARPGLVVKVVDWFTKQGGPELRNAANRIVVLHDDGTIASYVHLQFQGSLVAEGQQIAAGEKIGFSGLTGYTNGPHLHFVVRKERDQAIPVYFTGYEGKALKQGKRYKRNH
ncbi:M23 family metallopeptidase [Flavilitoribacter nigricans]|uniref:M23ase beta-sheet core domain-containing protein n=1 Tax=Flavilitoribacter nigricans (strain ATCC 23147 / DSM 23189 / NBRC 102662 / NCIMB 1420 / SS-2) TaxID=1122177 RepID=A0A2D0NEJ3_FLAN2|nr:M23 family metallopeptidase [Flavilitoribacter nigricans]PHN06800.1 hypothetical protein CRP01_10960 [Flavilitoribacter nigricans DSM 23189 = NBRC 102662]